MSNCVTLDTTGQLLRWGASDFENDGSFDSGTETYHADVGPRVSGVPMKYTKVVGGVLVEMSGAEKIVVDIAMLILFLLSPRRLRYPMDEPESLSSNGAISLTSYMTDLSGNVSMTLADGATSNLTKLILTQGGANATVTCSLDQTDAAYVSFSLGANNKARLVWRNVLGYWTIIDQKGLTKNT